MKQPNVRQIYYRFRRWYATNSENDPVLKFYEEAKRRAHQKLLGRLEGEDRRLFERLILCQTIYQIQSEETLGRSAMHFLLHHLDGYWRQRRKGRGVPLG